MLRSIYVEINNSYKHTHQKIRFSISILIWFSLSTWTSHFWLFNSEPVTKWYSIFQTTWIFRTLTHTEKWIWHMDTVMYQLINSGGRRFSLSSSSSSSQLKFQTHTHARTHSFSWVHSVHCTPIVIYLNVNSVLYLVCLQHINYFASFAFCTHVYYNNDRLC